MKFLYRCMLYKIDVGDDAYITQDMPLKFLHTGTIHVYGNNACTYMYTYMSAHVEQ